MAIIGSDPNGFKRILFVAGDGKRKTIRLGKATNKQAETFKVKVEAVVSSTFTGSLDDETSRWLAALEDGIHARLAAVGLVKPRESATLATLAPFVDDYIGKRPSQKPRTIINLKAARKDLVGFFGAAKRLADITEGDAEEFWNHLIGPRKLNDNSARAICRRAKQFLAFAVKKRVIRSNPFVDIKCHVGASAKDREFFITREMAAKCLDACPDAQWRLLFALSRFGGLRCPSEHLRLKWSHIDWERGRIVVESPKTEHHEGKASRTMPLFPELRPYLVEAFEAAEDGTEHVITRYRTAGTNLRTMLHKIIRRAGLEPWPKTFHNLRATRETELMAEHQAHVVCAWIGNSEAVARKHYLQVTDDDFARAVAASDSGTLSAAQNPAQSAAVSFSKARKVAGTENKNRPVLPGDSSKYRSVPDLGYPQGEFNTQKAGQKIHPALYPKT
jgi:integrase